MGKKKSSNIYESEPLTDIESQNNSENRKGVPWNVYKGYFKAGYGYIGTILLIFFFLGVQFCVVYTDYFVSDWANKENHIFLKSNAFNQSLNTEGNEYNHSINREGYDYNQSIETVTSGGKFIENRDYYILRYIIQAHAVLILLLARPLLYYIMCVKAAKRIFNQLLRAILVKKYNFFMKNSEGKLMNIFNRDQGVVDDVLASTNFDFLQISSFILATFGLAIFVNYFIAFPLVVLLAFLLLFRTYYIKTARQLKRYEADYRTPLLDILNATTSGISIIRTSKKTNKYKEMYNKKMDDYTMVNFPYISAKRWFALRLDIGIVIFIAFIIFGSVLVQNFYKNFPITPASIGLLITYCFQLSTQFQFCVRQSCEAECSMISVERIFKYIDTNKNPSEPNDKNDQNSSWPQNGKIELKNVTFRYNSNVAFVFENINFTFENGKHIGIIGYNGAGKSSFFNLLLRLYEINDGEIVIDGKNIKNISLKELRQKITIIPQDPVIFDATIRENLDPTGKIDNAEIIKDALRSAGLEQYANDKSLVDPTVLDSFSKGQKQLLCFARGILKDTKIYLVDEATSNLSREAEEKIRTVIHEKLKNKTVLIIAHHMETIEKCDKILGVHGHNRFEYDTPDNLKRDEESLYSRFLRGDLVNRY